MRVLAMASHKWEPSREEGTIENDLCFLGLVGIIMHLFQDMNI